MNDTEKNDEENAGDQATNAGEPADLITPELAPGLARYLEAVDRKVEAAIRPACGVEATHDRHVIGHAADPIHCAGYTSPEDDVPTYAATVAAWLEANSWAKTYATLVHHAQVLARKLDKAGDDAPAATSSAYLQAISRLERMRPGANPAGEDGDGLTPPGQQPSLFDPIGD